MTTSTKSTEKIDISADQSTPKNTIITPPGDNTPTSPTSPTSPLSKSSFTNDSLNSRLKLPTQIPIGNNQEKKFQSLSNISNSFNPLSNNPKVTRAASISVVPQSNFDYYNGFSSSLGTSPNTRLNRPDPLSSSLGGWPNKDIWPNDYTSPVDQARSPSFNKAPESPLGRSYINNFQDSMLSPRRSSYNPSDTPISAYGRTRNVATAEFPGRSRNPMNALKDEKFNMDRLSSSMSPMFGAPIDRSPLYRDYVGSPQLSGSLNQEYENEPPFALNPNEYYRVSLARRMSLTPNFGPYNPYDDLNAQMETLTLEEYAHILNRRHSVAASAFPNRKQSQMEQAEAPRLDTLKEDQDDQIEQFELDLEPIETPRTTNNGPKKETYYVVEFKGNRNDLFYPAPDCAPVIKMGEHVIVEGDRGKDLGIIIRTDITIDEYKNQFSQITAGPDGSQAIKEIEPKKIYRIALPHETASLVSKLQDEEKALMLVRAKAIQHEIYMQIVDAEYQWDRRKLTFYFIADRRIDFRDLVRELFKIYKTRIWMCAVSH